MATKGYVVAAVVGFSILLIVLIVWLATSAGSGSGSKSGGPPTGALGALGPPGSAGNWTVGQKAEQARLFGALAAMSDLRAAGFDATFVVGVSACAMEGASKVYSYEYMNKCNTGQENCAATEQDLRIMATCVGGEKGKWTPALKKIVIDGGRSANLPPELRAIYPCFVDWLASQYNFFDALAALGTIAAGKPGPVMDAVAAALAVCENKPLGG